MISRKTKDLNELSIDTGLTVHQGFKNIIGPVVSVNNPQVPEARFSVHDPLIREVARFDSAGTGFRLGNYKTSSGSTNTNYDIDYATGTGTFKQARSNTMTDCFYGGWDNDDFGEEPNGLLNYGGWVRYYREGSRVFLHGRAKLVKSYRADDTTAGSGGENILPLRFSSNGPLTTTANGTAYNATGVIFKLPTEFHPLRDRYFVCPIHIKFPAVGGSLTSANQWYTDYTTCRIVVNRTGEVAIDEIYPGYHAIMLQYAATGVMAYNTNGDYISKYGLFRRSCQVNFLPLDGIQWSLYDGGPYEEGVYQPKSGITQNPVPGE